MGEEEEEKKRVAFNFLFGEQSIEKSEEIEAMEFTSASAAAASEEKKDALEAFDFGVPAAPEEKKEEGPAKEGESEELAFDPGIPTISTERTESDLVKTGIPGLDQMLGGGLERKSIVILAGGPGTGKSTIGIQFLYNGATQFNENGMYITFEEKRPMVLKHSLNYGWNLDPLFRERKIVLLEYAPHEVDRFLSEGGIIEDMVHEHKIKRIVIDSLTSLLLLYESEYKRRQAFLRIIETLRKLNCTVLMTSEADVDRQGEVNARFGVGFLSDGLIALHSIRQRDILEVAVQIRKLRGVNHDRKISPLKFTSSGIVIYPSQPVFSRF